ncbi:2-dehydro-3-deoxy-6-phosphogalactonate aldolase, partial [Xanthomonas sp. Kuri4-3]
GIGGELYRPGQPLATTQSQARAFVQAYQAAYQDITG